MMNSIVLVGKLAEIKDVNEETILTIACPRQFKNSDVEYGTDFIDVKLFGQVSEYTKEYCKKGDTIGIKGRVQTKVIDDKKITELVAEKITFLTSNPSIKKEEE